LALASSCQICMARSADLPMGASPPVSAMPKPMVIGSSARAAASPVRVIASTAGTARRRAIVTMVIGLSFVWLTNTLPVVALHERVGGAAIVLQKCGRRPNDGEAPPLRYATLLRIVLLGQERWRGASDRRGPLPTQSSRSAISRGTRYLQRAGRSAAQMV